MTPEISLNIAGRMPEIWKPETEEIDEADSWAIKEGKTTVRLSPSTPSRPSTNRQTVVSFKFYEKADTLLPSGLLGPAVIQITK